MARSGGGTGKGTGREGQERGKFSDWVLGIGFSEGRESSSWSGVSSLHAWGSPALSSSNASDSITELSPLVDAMHSLIPCFPSPSSPSQSTKRPPHFPRSSLPQTPRSSPPSVVLASSPSRPLSTSARSLPPSSSPSFPRYSNLYRRLLKARKSWTGKSSRAFLSTRC